jgi:hypothetical protein
VGGSRRGAVWVLGSVALAATVGIGAYASGVRAASAGSGPRGPTQLTGADWMAFGPKEKDAYLNGFIAGAAAEQVRAGAAADAGTPDSTAMSSGAIERLRSTKQLRFSYAPSVYAVQIDDYYWWTDHRTTPIVDVMITLNRRMKSGDQ